MYRVMIITSTLLNNLFIMNSMGELEYNQPCMKCIKGCYTPSATEDIHLSDVTLWLCFIKRLRDWSVPVDESSSTLINAAFSSPFCSFVAFVPRGFEKLKERNPKWINDDYVKFIRFAEYMIQKNGEGKSRFRKHPRFQ